MIELFDRLERSDADRVVINTPASASATIDRQADLLVPTAAELGYEIRVGWMIGPGEDSARLSSESKLCAFSNRRVAIVNEFLCGQGKPVWYKHPARESWLKNGGIEARMPALVDRLASVVREQPGRISDLVKPESGLSVIERHALKRWLDACFAGPCELLASPSPDPEEVS